MFLAIKFLLTVCAEISPEFIHYYPHCNVSVSPHRKHFTVISIFIKGSINMVLEVHGGIITGKAASRPRLNWWVYSNFRDCNIVCGSWRWILPLASWPHETGKKRHNLPGLLSVHIRWMWRCLWPDQGDLNVLAVAAICGVLVSVYKVYGMRRCHWQSCLLTLSTWAKGGCRCTQRHCTTPGPRSKLQPGQGSNRPQLSCMEGKIVIFIEDNCIEQQ